jgi:hypothetical protein
MNNPTNPVERDSQDKHPTGKPNDIDTVKQNAIHDFRNNLCWGKVIHNQDANDHIEFWERQIDQAIQATRAAVRDEMVEDKKRLDFLDECNRRLNEQYRTNYGWELILNHNVTRLMSDHLEIDLNDAKGGNDKLPSCRDAIDKKMAELKYSQQQTEGGAK